MDERTTGVRRSSVPIHSTVLVCISKKSKIVFLNLRFFDPSVLPFSASPLKKEIAEATTEKSTMLSDYHFSHPARICCARNERHLSRGIAVVSPH